MYKKLIRYAVFILLLNFFGGIILSDSLEDTFYYFDHISFNEGLSQVTVNAILQDRKGFIWIGTVNGLNRYDGKNFNLYRFDPDNINSIRNSFVNKLLEDSEGYLWIGTVGGGLNRFDRRDETFTYYKNIKGNKESLSNNNITAIYEDREKNIWVGTRTGLNLLNKKTNNFKQFDGDIDSKNSISGKRINNIVEDKEGYLWIGTNSGLYRFDKKNGKSIVFKNLSNQNKKTNTVSALFIDTLNNLWIGTFSDGLFRFNNVKRDFIRYDLNKNNVNKMNSAITGISELNKDELWISTLNDGVRILNRENNRVNTIKMDLNKSDSLKSDSFTGIYKDKNGLIWLTSGDNGLNIYDPLRTRFIKKTIDIRENNNKSHYIVWDFFEENKSVLWIVTGIGLIRYDQDIDKYSVFKIKKKRDEQFSEVRTSSILADRKGVFWIGTTTDGLYTFDRQKRKFSKFKFQNKSHDDLNNSYVLSGFEDSRGILWFTTSNRGVIKINNDKKYIERFLYNPNDSNSIGGNTAITLTEDGAGLIWMGTTDGGLNKYDPKTKKFKQYLNISGDKTSINSNDVSSLYISDNNIIWVGTSRGFSKFNSKSETFIRYNSTNGYLDDPVYEIVEDSDKKVWIAGSRLTRFDPENNDFIFFNKRNGLTDGEFNSGAVLKSKYRKNKIYFGSTKGYNIVDTDNIKRNLLAPSVVFTKIKVNGKELKTGNNLYLKESISEIKEIFLPYKLNNIMLEFISLDFSNPLKNMYAYKIDGINEDWVHLGKSNEVVLINLAPGNYELLVKGSNNAGIWTKKAAKLKINIEPPFWATLWFKGLIFLFIVLLIILVYSKRVKTIEDQYKRDNVINEIMFKYNISKREREVIDLVVKGKSSKEIEDELYISLSTVNNHIYSILKKMNLKNRGELIVLVKTAKVS